MTRQQLSRALGTPLLWRLLPWLFTSVALVQLFALYPLIDSYRSELYERRARALAARLESLLVYAQTAHAAPAPRSLARDVLDGVLANVSDPALRGIRIHDGDGNVLAARGTAPPEVAAAGALPRLVEHDAATLAMGWHSTAAGGLSFRALLDVSEELATVQDFVWKAAVLGIPSALLATLAASATLLFGVILPLQRLQSEVLERARSVLEPERAPPGYDDELEQLRLLVDRFDAARKTAREAEQRAHAASKAKDEFLANMSHELRTPLASIISYTDLLLETAPPEPALVRDLETIGSSARHVAELVDHILAFGKLQAGRVVLTLEHCDARPIAEQAAAIVGPLLAANSNELALELPAAPAPMYTDPLKLRQCLVNLLGNAAKFTHDGRVGLSLATAAEHGRPFSVFRIEDTGIGMTAAELASAFEPFVQGDGSVTRRYGGTGLGLSITARYARMLGGRVEVESEPGRGSRFTLWLPKESSPEIPESPGTAR